MEGSPYFVAFRRRLRSQPPAAGHAASDAFCQILDGNPETSDRLSVSTPGRVFEWIAVNSFLTIANFLKTLAFLRFCLRSLLARCLQGVLPPLCSASH